MTSSELRRPYPLAVRPLHRETAESYLDRLVAKNFETIYHRNFLDRLARVQYPALKGPERFAAIAEHKAGRRLPLLTNPKNGLAHADGTTCEACTDGIGEQYLCTHCGNGATVRQHPHLDGHVCLAHHRWVGPGTQPQDQVAVDGTVIRADLTFRKLRARRLMDAPFYLLLKSLLFGRDTTVVGPQQFKKIVSLAVALTNEKFGIAFFNPSTPYSIRFAFLRATLERELGRSALDETIELWLRFRPTVVTVHDSIQHETPFVHVGPHDLPVRISIARRHWSTRPSGEPFTDYLQALPKGTSTIRNGKDLSRVHLYMKSDSAAKGSLATICTEGHRCSWVYKNGDTTCPICTNRLIVVGINNLSFLFPQIAAEWAPELNRSRDVDSVARGSNFVAWWICPDGHAYRKAVGARTLGGGCSKCPRPFDKSRSIRIARPDLAQEFDLTSNGEHTPDNLTIGSKRKVEWTCPSGHRYSQIVERRDSGYGCPFCSGRRFERGINDFGTLFPKLAQEWDFTNNAVLHPGDRISRLRKVAWRCIANSHEYEQTITHRILSNGCPLCDPTDRIEAT
jgi:hypothetical protein